MNLIFNKAAQTLTVLGLLTGSMISLAHADDNGKHAPPPQNSKWQAECGSCHVAYPPRLLPAESWRAVMSGLSKHFGSDASVDVSSATEITDFLERNAGKKRDAGPALLRITETRWFKREHDEVADRVWKNPKINSPANCAACHTQAESGNYSERNIRIPK
jgi:hypothetical protein